MHVDLGGMNMPFVDMEHLFIKGLAKSRTLRTCHLIGVSNYGPTKLKELFKIISVRDNGANDLCSRLDIDKLNRIFEK